MTNRRIAESGRWPSSGLRTLLDEDYLLPGLFDKLGPTLAPQAGTAAAFLNRLHGRPAASNLMLTLV